MIRSEKAVSEITGMVLIVSIMMLVIGSIMLVGVPMIDSSRNKARMDVAMNSFLSLQNDIEEVVRGPIWVKNPLDVTNVNRLGPSRETELELMGGSLSAAPSPTVFKILNVANLTLTKEDNFTISGDINYIAGPENIAYENGAVIRKYESGEAIMVSDPLISIYNTLDNTTVADSNITVSIHAIGLNGTLSSVGGDGKAWVEIRPENYSQVIPPSVAPNTNQVNVNISSAYPEAWEAFFVAKLRDAGLKRQLNKTIKTGYYISNIGRTLEIVIYGPKSAGEDIFFSFYVSKLDVKVR